MSLLREFMAPPSSRREDSRVFQTSAWKRNRGSVEGSSGSRRAGREHALILRDGAGEEAAGGFFESRVFPRLPRDQRTPTFVRRQEFIPGHEVSVAAEHWAISKHGRSVVVDLRDHLGHDVRRDIRLLRFLEQIPTHRLPPSLQKTRLRRRSADRLRGAFAAHSNHIFKRRASRKVPRIFDPFQG
jgi:hypothetical protein